MKQMLALLTALMMLLVPAFAATAEVPVYPPELTALKAALALLRETYGFSITTVGVFCPEITLTEDSARVVFKPYDFLPMDRLGEYTVTLSGETAEISWSHDDKDAALKQSGDPASPVWGHAQLQTYFNQGVLRRDYWVEPYIDPLQEDFASPKYHEGLTYTWKPLEWADIPAEQLHKTANAALRDIYALTDEELAIYRIIIEKGVLQCEDGQEYWHLCFSGTDSIFDLLIDAHTGNVLRIKYLSGGRG
ncbi:MAG: hypothetical protein IJB81_00145 [Clostridia bacterium]|nr:hypothetical protein [Clostridia bacterium]